MKRQRQCKILHGKGDVKCFCPASKPMQRKCILSSSEEDGFLVQKLNVPGSGLSTNSTYWRLQNSPEILERACRLLL